MPRRGWLLIRYWIRSWRFSRCPMQRTIELHQAGFDGQASLFGPRACVLRGFVPAIAAYLVAHEVEQLDVGAESDALDQLANLQAQGCDPREGGQSGIRLAFVRLDWFAPRERRF